MAQPGNFTPILLYSSSTSTNVPLAANLTNSTNGAELAINIADKNLFFKDSGGTVNTVPIRQSSTSSNGWLSATDWNTFNNKAPATSGSSILYGNGSGGFSNVTIGTGLSFTGGTLSSTLAGGTVTSVAATVPAFLSISGSPITTSGTLAISYSGTALPIANGGTGTTTTFTTGSVLYAGASGVYSQDNANFFWDATSKRLGIGTSSPQNIIDAAFNSSTLVQGLRVSNLSQSNQYITVSMAGTTPGVAGWDNSGIVESVAASVGSGTRALVLSAYSGPLIFQTNGRTEAGRFDTSGNLLIGTTSAAGRITAVGAGMALSAQGGGGAVISQIITTDTTGNPYMQVYYTDTSSNRGSVQYNRGTGLMLYNTTSDARLKKNIAPVGEVGDIIDQIEIVSHDWKDSDAHTDYSVIAQQLYSVVPQAVLKGDDSNEEIVEIWQVDHSKLVPLLVKEIQSLRARLKTANIA